MSSSIITKSLLAPVARAVHYIAARDDCDNGDTSARCEKPFQTSKIIGITVGATAAVLIFGTLGVLTVLHMRRNRVERKEDEIDLEIDGDVYDYPATGKPTRAWQPHGGEHNQPGNDNPFEAERQPHQRAENPFEPERR
ncbi:hypothetical protein CORC01_01065 [Colletotrichum orchidophilum]|uniref:Uncharacterized protein n=1 Tax=Colletotrichum orchidophilum TaxID=1209926 RepID=A0A1G4BR29_9PEZI|nr:uncharacterized protein CORC01_01065 [Colletotrichum orchidophilum]OHF03746.1 hypothetical protein CORC01_01065 [Colletotrichum orchidophilum]